MKTKKQKMNIKAQVKYVGDDLRVLFGFYKIDPDNLLDITDGIEDKDLEDFRALVERDDEYINVNINVTCEQAVNIFNQYSYKLAGIIREANLNGYSRSTDKDRKE